MKACDGEVLKVYLQAPGIKTDRTKKADATLKGLAQDFNMTNIKSTREGEHQAGYFQQGNILTPEQRLELEKMEAQQPKEQRPGDAAIWGGGFKGVDLNSVIAGRYAMPIADEPVGIRPQDAGDLTGPKAASYIADHENLSIKP
jgi:hypothetical protein